MAEVLTAYALITVIAKVLILIASYLVNRLTNPRPLHVPNRSPPSGPPEVSVFRRGMKVADVWYREEPFVMHFRLVSSLTQGEKVVDVVRDYDTQRFRDDGRDGCSLISHIVRSGYDLTPGEYRSPGDYLYRFYHRWIDV